MHRFAVDIKGAVWSKLKVIYDKYTNGAEFITVANLESLVKEVLHEQTPSEVDYVVRNMNRIDTDNSGTVQFEEFGNFLLKRHCGEMALQKMHGCNRIKNGSVRKITREEFGQLLNRAYEFLGVQVEEKVYSEIFDNVDADRDGLISYAQYFGFTDIYLLDTKPVQQKKKPLLEKVNMVRTKSIDVSQPAKEFNSRLRNFLRSQLRRIFHTFDKDSNNLLDNEELREMLMSLFGTDINESNSVITRYFRADTEGRYQSYNAFVDSFLVYAGEIGWLKVSKNFPGRTSFNQQQFIRLVEQSFRHLDIERVNKTLLVKFFLKLDTNNDGLVEISDFRTWISKFLSPRVHFGGVQYFVMEDDENSPLGRGMIMETLRRVDQSAVRSLDTSIIKSSKSIDSRVEVRKKAPRPSMKMTDSMISVSSNRSGRQLVCRFAFSSQHLAKRVRDQMMIILHQLDKNHNMQFEKPQIIEALQVLMKADKREVMYVISNVFRYDRNGDNIVTYQELANFFLEIHFGEIAIQRLHKEDTYVRGAQRMMNRDQFVKTLDYALSFIEIQAFQGQLETLFSEIDLKKQGWITYQVYFEFLIHYFGTESVAAQVQKRGRKTLFQLIPNKGQEITPEQRISKLIRTQIRVMFIEFDRNKNLQFQKSEVLSIAKEVLNQTDEEAGKSISTVFDKNQTAVDYDRLVDKLLDIHTSQLVLIKLHKEGFLKNYRERTLDLNDFVNLVSSAFVNVSVLPSKKQFVTVFNRMESSGKITYRQYQHFASRYFGKSEGHSFNTTFEQPIRQGMARKLVSALPNSGQDRAISAELINSLRAIYQRFDQTNRGIDRCTFEQFLIECLGKAKRQKHIEHILWAIYRVDQNSDGLINLNQSITYLLKLQAQLTLQDLHRSTRAIQNKQRLSCEDYLSVLKLSYPFCENLKREWLTSAFQTIDSDKDGYISDRDCLSWINSVSKGCTQL